MTLQKQPIHRCPRRRPSYGLLHLPVLMALTSGALAQTPDANDQVLARWQQQGGQAGTLNAQGVVEFRGSASVDLYHQDVDVDSGNPTTLSGLRPGNHQRTSVQFDLRHTIPDQRITYLQGGVVNSDDLALQPRFATQITTLQAGIAGVGYRLALGDVAVNFSNLGTNLGIRGLWGDWQHKDFGLTYYAGAVGESWEALTGQRPRQGGPSNLQPLRDVMGIKADYRFSPALQGFATLQRYEDRRGDLQEAALFNGHAGSLGLRYADQTSQAYLEWARSEREPSQGPGGSQQANALQVGVSHRLGKHLLRGGYNDIRPGFHSLVQMAAPGVKEWYAGADWTLTPQLAWSVDARDALSRQQLAGALTRTELRTLGNRLTYRFADVDGLSLTLADLRNRNEDASGKATPSSSTQATLGYARDGWSAQGVLGYGETRAPTGKTKQQQWQASLGRSFAWPGDTSLSLQGSLGQTETRYSTAASAQRQDAAAVNVGYTHPGYGQWNLGSHWQRLVGGAGVNDLASTSLTLDWALPLGQAATLKSYLRLSNRNRGDATRHVEEQTAGVQLSYLW